jgi:hypothetical protein
MERGRALSRGCAFYHQSVQRSSPQTVRIARHGGAMKWRQNWNLSA